MTTREEYCKLLTVAGSILASALIAVFLNPNDALSKQLAAPLFCMLGFLFAEFSVIMCAVYVGGSGEQIFQAASLSFVVSLCLAMVAMIVSSQGLYAHGVFAATASVGSVWAALMCIFYARYSWCKSKPRMAEGQAKREAQAAQTAAILLAAQAQTLAGNAVPVPHHLGGADAADGEALA